MQTVSEALELLKRQAEIEAAMKQPGGIRINEEQELRVLRRRLEQFPAAVLAAVQTAHALRRPISNLSVSDIESWASRAAHDSVDAEGALFRPVSNNRTGELDNTITPDGVHKLVRRYALASRLKIGARVTRNHSGQSTGR